MLLQILFFAVPISVCVLITWAKIHGETNTERHGHSWRTPIDRRKDKLERLRDRAYRYADRNGLK